MNSNPQSGIIPLANSDSQEVHSNTNTRALELFQDQLQLGYHRTDWLFVRLFVFEWLAAIFVAIWYSPLAWAGDTSTIHPHITVAFFLGGGIICLPILLAFTRPGLPLTRHTVAIGQMLMSALLIHLCGGRVETHFHVFGSLTFLAFYRDWRVIITATVVVALDHMIRGYFWPFSTYGVLTASEWRWVEHSAWVAFLDLFLIHSCLVSLREIRGVAERQAELESINEIIEHTVQERTTELASANVHIQEACEQAKMADAAKSQFLANMSHEIRTPLNGILGFTDLLRQESLLPQQKEMLELVHTSAESLIIIINDILDVSKIEAGKLELEPRPFSLRDLLQSILSLFAINARQKNIGLQCLVPVSVPNQLLGDSDRLRQILINLIGNAIKFTKVGLVRLSLQVEPFDSTASSPTASSPTASSPTASSPVMSESSILLRFSIEDTGIGIPQDKLQAIFQPFEQADNSMTRKYGGTGLGLTICSRLVSLMGGRIDVQSVVGCGSTFSFTAVFQRLPQPQKGPSGPGENQSSAPNELWNFAFNSSDVTSPVNNNNSSEPSFLPFDGSNSQDSAASSQLPLSQPLTRGPRSVVSSPTRVLRILVAEDNPVNQMLTAHMLKVRGHEVVVVNDGREAVDAIKREPFDLVLMDIQMPIMDGLAATQAIRASETPPTRLPIVAMTAHAMKGVCDRCFMAGMNGYLTKPLRAKDLHEMIERLVAPSTDEGVTTVSLSYSDTPQSLGMTQL